MLTGNSIDETSDRTLSEHRQNVKNTAVSEGEVPRGRHASSQQRRRQAQTADEDPEAELRKMEEDLERSHFVRSVLVKTPRSYGHRRESRNSAREHHKSVTQQVHLERIRQDLDAPPADWRKVLAMMAEETPEASLDWIEDGLKIEVPEEILSSILARAGDEKIGSIRRRTGAILKVSWHESMVLVSGTRQAINKAIAEFRKMAGKMTITRLYTPLGPGEARIEHFEGEASFYTPPLSREENAYAKKRRIRHHARETPVPQIWTPKSIEEYVIALVDSVVDRSLQAPIYKPDQRRNFADHEGAVARGLHQLFHQEPVLEVAPRSAFILALTFLCEKGNKYMPEARELFVLMDRRGLAMDTDVFNILLRGAVKIRDLRGFHQGIRRMTSRGLAPNLDTWILFLRMFESVEVRSYVLQTMHVKNLLSTNEAIERVAKEMAEMDTEHAVRQRKDLATFLREQKERYGPSWLTRNAGNQVLHVLGMHGRFDDAFALVDMMLEASTRDTKAQRPELSEDSARRPDAASFNTIIARAHARSKIPLAVNVLRKMRSRQLTVQPNVQTLHFLFEMVWKARMRTAIVVLWRYASLARLTSYGMRSRVAALMEGPMVPDRVVGPGEDTDKHRVTGSTYRELGGEILARELAGGSRALQKLRATLLAWGNKKRKPKQKVAAIASRAAFEAFGDALGPSVGLGEVLAQAVLVDIRCLRARKTGTLLDVLGESKVKTMELWPRRKDQHGWVDLAPAALDLAENIKPSDQWVDEWESEGWNLVPQAPNSVSKTDNGGLTKTVKSEGGTVKQDGKAESKHSRKPPATSAIRYAIINPRVWADQSHNSMEGRPASDEDSRQTEVQRQNEEAILAALEELKQIYVKNASQLAADIADEAGEADEGSH